jgi:hypothetical protein
LEVDPVNRTQWSRISATVAAVVAVITLFAAAPCNAQVWGIQPNLNRIVRINPMTGIVSNPFTPPGGALAPGQLFGGLTMAEHGAVMLYQNPVTNPRELFRLNPITGALLNTHTMPQADTPDFRAGLSFQSGAGQGGLDAIYAVNNGGPIQRQDGYNDLTLSNHTPGNVEFAGALGGDDNGRQFVAIVNGIQEFHPSIPNSILNTLPLPAAIADVGGLAFDGNWIYLSTLSGRLLTIHPNTGVVANNVLVQGGALIGLASRQIPEPGSAVLVAVGGMLLSSRTMRRRQRT